MLAARCAAAADVGARRTVRRPGGRVDSGMSRAFRGDGPAVRSPASDTADAAATRPASRGSGLGVRLALACGATLFALLLAEVAYRWLDPYPYIPEWERNKRPHGNLTQYDAELGWAGVPSKGISFATENARVWKQNNALGFRDVEPGQRRPDAPAIVFLGDSFTWGYEVGQDEMFVSRLRGPLGDYELFNLSHGGYGTDQSLLTWRRWDADDREVPAVVLVFCSNDIADNFHAKRYQKPKPHFELVDGELHQSDEPLPRVRRWDAPDFEGAGPEGWGERIGEWLLRSHLVHDMYTRWQRRDARPLPAATEEPGVETTMPAATNGAEDPAASPRLQITEGLLELLRDDVAARGSRLLVAAIPSKAELFEGRFILGDGRPYQLTLEGMCARLGIPYHDLAPDFRAAPRRTYFRDGWHWTAYGHGVAARSLERFLRDQGL